MTFRWAVELIGDQFDKDDACNLFGPLSKELRVEKIDVPGHGTIVALMASELDSLSTSTEVHEANKRIFDLLNGVLFVHDANRKPVRPGIICERDKSGAWGNPAVFASIQSVLGRTRVTAMGTVVHPGGQFQPPPPPLPPPHVTWMKAASTDDVVSDVLTYLRGDTDWFDLYKAFELMRDDINLKLGGQNKYPQMGWPQKTEIDAFSQSAQVYRHSPVKWPAGYNQATAMSEVDAKAFIRNLVSTWLQWRYP